jgi:hypothetical protein
MAAIWGERRGRREGKGEKGIGRVARREGREGGRNRKGVSGASHGINGVLFLLNLVLFYFSLSSLWRGRWPAGSFFT